MLSNLGTYESKLGHNYMEATKNICCLKGQGAVDHNTLTKWFKRFCSNFKNLINQVRSGKPKTEFQCHAQCHRSKVDE